MIIMNFIDHWKCVPRIVYMQGERKRGCGNGWERDIKLKVNRDRVSNVASILGHLPPEQSPKPITSGTITPRQPPPLVQY